MNLRKMNSVQSPGRKTLARSCWQDAATNIATALGMLNFMNSPSHQPQLCFRCAAPGSLHERQLSARIGARDAGILSEQRKSATKQRQGGSPCKGV